MSSPTLFLTDYQGLTGPGLPAVHPGTRSTKAQKHRDRIKSWLPNDREKVFGNECERIKPHGGGVQEVCAVIPIIFLCGCGMAPGHQAHRPPELFLSPSAAS